MKFYEMQKIMLDSLNDPAKKAMLPTEIENKISECNTVCAVLIKHFAHYLELAEKEKMQTSHAKTYKIGNTFYTGG